MKRFERVELSVRRQAEIDAGHTIEGLREVLDDGPGRE